MSSLQLFTIGKAMHNAKIEGNEDLHTKLSWFYKKYQKVHLHEKEYIWGQFIGYCREEGVDISMPLLEEKQKKAA